MSYKTVDKFKESFYISWVNSYFMMYNNKDILVLEQQHPINIKVKSIKPKLLSDALCTFLNIPSGSKLSITDVVRKLCDYTFPRLDKNRKNFTIDEPLSKLFELNVGEHIDSSRLRELIEPHILKEESGVN